VALDPLFLLKHFAFPLDSDHSTTFSDSSIIFTITGCYNRCFWAWSASA